MHLLFVGIVLNTILGLAATWAAARNRVRGVHPKLCAYLRGDLGSLAGYSPEFVGFNHAAFVLGTHGDGIEME